MVMLFEFQLQEFFCLDQVLVWFNSLCDKFIVLCDYGVDQVLCVWFNEFFCSFIVEVFVCDLLVEGLGIDYLVVGDDFCFGCGCDGDFDYLKQVGEWFGFQVIDMLICEVDGEWVFSMWVCVVLEQGDFCLVECLLGWFYIISGWVCYGDKLGCILDVLMVNLVLKWFVLLLYGVFVVWVFGVGFEDYLGVVNMGMWLLVDGQENCLEVYLFDFQGDLYDVYLSVVFYYFVWLEEKFDGFDEFKVVMWWDLEQV